MVNPIRAEVRRTGVDKEGRASLQEVTWERRLASRPDVWKPSTLFRVNGHHQDRTRDCWPGVTL